MGRVNFIEHKGRRLLHIDFTKCTAEQVMQIIPEAKRIIASQPPNTVLTLTDVTGSGFNDVTNQAMQDYVAHNKPYVKAAAVVGATGLRKIVMNAIRLVTKRDLATFDTLDQAKEWLALR